ncbi:MAG: leucine-rich repeat domain-containing protein [Ruminococcus sp.]|nr:leucine-rich repeat domain-containing protein [Ruminococcus sp.]
MAVRYEITPAKQSILQKRVSSFWSLLIIALCAAIVVLLARYTIELATEEITYTYGPISATSIAEDYFDYEINVSAEGESYVTITGYHGDLKEVNIPSEIDGVRVREIARFAFMSNDVIYIVRIPEGVTTIGNMCFYNSPTLKRVYIPETASSIGGWCFGNSTDLVVEGIIGSEAQSYCEQRGISFEGYSYEKVE